MGRSSGRGRASSHPCRIESPLPWGTRQEMSHWAAIATHKETETGKQTRQPCQAEGGHLARQEAMPSCPPPPAAAAHPRPRGRDQAKDGRVTWNRHTREGATSQVTVLDKLTCGAGFAETSISVLSGKVWAPVCGEASVFKPEPLKTLLREEVGRARPR